MRPNVDQRGARGFVGDEFHKYYKAEAPIEFEKARRLFDLARDAGFVFPEPVRLDAGAGLIVFRRLAEMQSVRQPYLDFVSSSKPDQDAKRIFAECGRVLAAIHGGLVLDTKSEWTPPPGFQELSSYATGEHVFLHGDFGFANVFRRSSPNAVSAELVVIDASPNYYFTETADCYGPRYVDIANMCACLDGLVPMIHHFRIRPNRIRELKERFLDGYRIASGIEVSSAVVNAFTKACAVTYLRFRFSSSWLSSLAIGMLYNKMRRAAVEI